MKEQEELFAIANMYMMMLAYPVHEAAAFQFLRHLFQVQELLLGVIALVFVSVALVRAIDQIIIVSFQEIQALYQDQEEGELRDRHHHDPADDLGELDEAAHLRDHVEEAVEDAPDLDLIRR